MTRVLVVRHGETDWNRQGRVQGWAPTGLTDRGREQAAALGSWLDGREIDRVLGSDLRRARETLAVAGETADGLPDPAVDRAWRERGFGVYQGFLAEELFRRTGQTDGTSVSALDAAPEGGESVDEFVERVTDAWTGLRDRVGDDETVLLVTHGGVVKVLLSVVDGREAALDAHSPPNCSVTELRIGESAAELLTEGATPWRA
ncbi:histidine phosphatase family protein [Haloarcula litorea]|uniref:histidine phosphatase family protein n=1 Tax=Haloarcula litorea TaxID=3032579 RepID=UPI0023E7EA86|nr:histidine phosphatase family protein [Halomicroarcula sp. GDY20]